MSHTVREIKQKYLQPDCRVFNACNADSIGHLKCPRMMCVHVQVTKGGGLTLKVQCVQKIYSGLLTGYDCGEFVF